MAISSIGVGSGLPIEDILSDLRKVENQALQLIDQRKTDVTNRISAYGTIRSGLETLKSLSDSMAKPGTFGAMKATVNSDAISVVAGGTAIAGQYEVNVSQLATAQSMVAQGRADRDQAIGADGKLTITLANGATAELDLTGKDTSLKGLVAAINAHPDIGVNATLVNDGSGTPHRLLLTARDTGTEAAVASITVEGNEELADFLGVGDDPPSSPLGNLTVSAARNAELTINGIDIVSQSNVVEGAIEGLTLTLAKPTETAARLSVTSDPDVASKALQSFVSTYNSLLSTIDALTKYDVETQQGSVLTGDSLARNVVNRLRGALNASVGSDTIRNLADLGITTNITNGRLELDNDKLKAALKDHMGAVGELFTGENGISANLAKAVDSFVSGGNSQIAIATDGAKRIEKDLKSQYDAAVLRIDSRMEAYRQQFTALDTTVARMNGISTYLTQQLSMLANLNSQGKN